MLGNFFYLFKATNMSDPLINSNNNLDINLSCKDNVLKGKSIRSFSFSKENNFFQNIDSAAVIFECDKYFFELDINMLEALNDREFYFFSSEIYFKGSSRMKSSRFFLGGTSLSSICSVQNILNAPLIKCSKISNFDDEKFYLPIFKVGLISFTNKKSSVKVRLQEI